MRLDKFLAESAIGTRKVVRDYIKDGKVSVNDRSIVDPASEIDECRDIIRYLNKQVLYPGKVYYMFHKPTGCVTARKDLTMKTVLDYFPPDLRNMIFPIGRLDKDTEGLLLLSNDGNLEHQLMHPDKHVEKTYFFWAFGTLDNRAKDCLKAGVVIEEDETVAKALKLQVEMVGTYQDYEEIMKLINVLSLKRKDNEQPVVSGYITISEGRRHQIKRMLKAVGCYVVYLKRVSIGKLMIDAELKKGQYRELSREELNLLV
jgi:16S rRNA pseudouridine516 synthase